jgi:ABC-2 type transport system permease protein
VYDRGYRPYEGERGGRGAARAALVRLSIRRAIGLRRSWRQKVLPWSLLAIATIPAVINVGLKYVTRNTPAADIDLITFRDYVGVSTTLLLFIAVTAPDMVCPDRRNRVLPLIFARPLTGGDYVLAKVGALTAVLFAFGFLPQVVLFVGQMLVVEEGALDFLTENAEVLWQVPLSVALFSLYWASLALALSATTTRRIVGGVALLATVFVSGVVSSILVAAGGADVESLFEDGSLWGLLNVLELPLRMTDLVFLGHVDPTSLLGGAAGAGLGVIAVSAAVVAGSVGYLVARYRRVP